jgi:hypothetical protein
MPGSLAPSVWPSEERRNVVRFPCDFPITIEWGAASLQGNVVDISSEGMFVKLNDPLWIGARFAAQLALEKPVMLECVVRRVQPLRGMALTYQVPDEAERAMIATAIERLSRQ